MYMQPKLQILALSTIILVQIGTTSTFTSCSPQNLARYGVSEAEKRLILDMHNRMRQMVANGRTGRQPPAANMMQLKWSNALANKAQQWAMSCSGRVHDPTLTLGSHPQGQNVASRWKIGALSPYAEAAPEWYNDALVKWFDEYKLYNINGYSSGVTGHYTQMVWANTEEVGCGYSFYLENYRYLKKYICNYGPGGNYIGQRPYEMGTPNCQRYGLINSRTYPGLCERALQTGTFTNFQDVNHLNNYYVYFD